MSNSEARRLAKRRERLVEKIAYDLREIRLIDLSAEVDAIQTKLSDIRRSLAASKYTPQP